MQMYTESQYSQLLVHNLDHHIESCDVSVFHPVFCAEVGIDSHTLLHHYHIH